jgi:RND superfamily putative drug exporter
MYGRQLSIVDLEAAAVFAFLAQLGITRPRWIAATGAIAFLVFAVLGGQAPGKLAAPRAFNDPRSQSTYAREQVERATGHGAYAEVVALVRAGPASLEVAHVTRELRADPAVWSVRAPSAVGHSPLVSGNTTETLLPVVLRAGVSPNTVVDRFTSTFRSDHTVSLGGDLFATRQAGKQATRDLALAELIAFPLLAILSLLIFRGVGALLPVSVGALSVFGSFTALRGVNGVLSLSPFALNLVIGLGLGLAVDYSLLFVSRFREELARTGDTPDALRATLQSAGRTVTFSAVTVAAAMACLTVFPQRFLVSMGIGGAAVALVAAAVTLLLLPAVLVLLSSRLGKVRPLPDSSGRWYQLATAVMRQPAAVAAGVTALLLVVAIPATGIRWTGIDAAILPTSQSARAVADAVAADFPSADTSPLSVVATAPPTAASTLGEYAQQLRGIGGIASVSQPRYVGAGTWQLIADARGNPGSDRAQTLVASVRAQRARFPVVVGGAAADLYDQHRAVTATLPIALVLLVSLTVSVLWLMTGSVVLPIKALLMNVLSTAAAAGLVAFVFQDGHLVSLIGASKQRGIEQTDFLVLVAIVFGLSTDYGVFLLTRIKEARDRGLSNSDAIAAGIQRTGAIVSAAAVLLAVALGAFMTGKVVFLKELGLGAVAAVLIDAFVVRALLVPALMNLLGGATWWSPAPLRRLHDRLASGESGPVRSHPAAARSRA